MNYSTRVLGSKIFLVEDRQYEAPACAEVLKSVGVTPGRPVSLILFGRRFPVSQVGGREGVPADFVAREVARAGGGVGGHAGSGCARAERPVEEVPQLRARGAGVARAVGSVRQGRRLDRKCSELRSQREDGPCDL